MIDTIRRELRDALLHPGKTSKALLKVPKRVGRILRNVRKQSEFESTGATSARLQAWISDIRDDVDSTTSATDILRGQTTIPNNYGTIITMTRDNVELFDMGPGRVYEERTKMPVLPQAFTSIAVPLNKVATETQRVHALGLDFPVLPIEAVDYHLSKFPLSELTTATRVK